MTEISGNGNMIVCYSKANRHNNFNCEMVVISGVDSECHCIFLVRSLKCTVMVSICSTISPCFFYSALFSHKALSNCFVKKEDENFKLSRRALKSLCCVSAPKEKRISLSCEVCVVHSHNTLKNEITSVYYSCFSLRCRFKFRKQKDGITFENSKTIGKPLQRTSWKLVCKQINHCKSAIK